MLILRVRIKELLLLLLAYPSCQLINKDVYQALEKEISVKFVHSPASMITGAYPTLKQLLL